MAHRAKHRKIAATRRAISRMFSHLEQQGANVRLYDARWNELYRTRRRASARRKRQNATAVAWLMVFCALYGAALYYSTPGAI